MAAEGGTAKPATAIDYTLPPHWQYTLKDIESSPSRADGISRLEEDAMRQGNIRFMNDVAMLLFDRPRKAGKLTTQDLRRIISTAAVLFNRFFIRTSFKEIDAKLIAVGCLLAATKIEDKPTALTRVVKYYLVCRLSIQAKDVVEKSERFMEARDGIEQAERRVLHTCEFDFDIYHPWRFLRGLVAGLLKGPAAEPQRKVLWKNSCKCVNEACVTPLCLLLNAHELAQGCVRFAATLMHIQLPEEGDASGVVWREVLPLSDKDYELVVNTIRAVSHSRTAAVAQSAAAEQAGAAEEAAGGDSGPQPPHAVAGDAGSAEVLQTVIAPQGGAEDSAAAGQQEEAAAQSPAKRMRTE